MKKLTATLILLTLFAFEIADIRSIYIIPLEANAVCATDYDLDDDLDVVINHGYSSQTGWGGTYILKNDSYGHFSLLDSVFGTTGAWNIIADTVLSKTYPDVVYYSYDSITILTRAGENYIKHRYHAGPKVNNFDLGDVDGNGLLDVVFSSSQRYYWGIIYNLGDNNFTDPEYYYYEYVQSGVASEDLNNDGKAEVVKVGTQSEIYFYSDSGFQVQPLHHNAGHVKIADLDNDGDNDIITFSDAYVAIFVHVYENLGNNVFDTVNNFTIYEGSSDFFVTDFNNDSLPDALFLTHDFNDKSLLLWYNEGNFQFGHQKVINLEHHGEARRFMHCADMDGNGYVDIRITRQAFDTAHAPSYLEILFNDGHGNFVEEPLAGVPASNLKHQALNLSCSPNPFSNRVKIEYSLPEDVMTELCIYNMQGKKIKTLENNKQKKGKYTCTWDGTDNCRKEVSPGIYLVGLKMNEKPLLTNKILKQN